jgi:hypothetical protein
MTQGQTKSVVKNERVKRAAIVASAPRRALALFYFIFS